MVDCLLYENWKMYKSKIIRTYFIPFLIYLLSMINWMVYALKEEDFSVNKDGFFKSTDLEIVEQIEITKENDLGREHIPLMQPN